MTPRLTAFVLAIALAPALAQAQSVALKLSRTVPAAIQPANSVVIITLESGTQITIPITDFDAVATRQLLNMPPRAADPPATPTQQDSVIRQGCAKDFPNDFSTRAYCEKRQREAVAALASRAMTSTDQQTIRRKCTADYPVDFSTRDYCERRQLEALAQLNR